VIVLAGEALIDLMPRASEVGAGEAQRFDARPGGVPCNVVGLTRLGGHTCFLGRVGSDPFGRLLREHLREAGLDTSLRSRKSCSPGRAPCTWAAWPSGWPPVSGLEPGPSSGLQPRPSSGLEAAANG
jgi:sugar/nucleoside kinase (ribokinase family)